MSRNRKLCTYTLLKGRARNNIKTSLRLLRVVCTLIRLRLKKPKSCFVIHLKPLPKVYYTSQLPFTWVSIKSNCVLGTFCA